MDFFHCVGIQPVIRDILNNLVKEGVILAATDLSILVECDDAYKANLHCKNKLVVLTTEWLPWLQTNWRDSGYERFSLVLKSNCIRQPKMPLSSSSYNHSTLTTLRTSVNESLQLHFKVAVYCNFEVQL